MLEVIGAIKRVALSVRSDTCKQQAFNTRAQVISRYAPCASERPVGVERELPLPAARGLFDVRLNETQMRKRRVKLRFLQLNHRYEGNQKRPPDCSDGRLSVLEMIGLVG